ncbi:MAG: Y-family DNA polymerase [Pseudomonadales bacterium]
MSCNNPQNQALWLCLYFPQIALDRVSRDQTATGQALVVTEKQRVYQCNAAARDLGIAVGQSMDTAFSLSEQVATIERQPDQEIASLQHLAQWAYQFTPHVVVKSDDCLLLEISGSLKLFRGLQNLAAQVLSGLKERGYQATLATYKTPLGAMLLARSAAHTGKLEVSIEPVAIAFLQTSEKIIAGLQQMGIVTVAQLLGLPGSGIQRRFGTYFSDYLQRLIGTKPDPQKYISPAARFYHSVTFMHDVNNLSSLAFPINRLLGELTEFLTQRQYWVSHLTWQLSHRARSERRSISVQLAAPVNNLKMFLALTQLKLDQVDDVQEVDQIALKVTRFFPAGENSDDLFAGRGFEQQLVTHTTTDQQNQLLNMLNAKLGADACFGLSEQNDHRPEKAWGKVKPGSKDYWQPQPVVSNNSRPGFLLPTPRALQVIDNKPYLAGQLTLLKGPERIDFGWWDQPVGKPLTRDYYIARQKQGGLVWIFKYLAAERWYLHGIFS